MSEQLTEPTGLQCGPQSCAPAEWLCEGPLCTKGDWTQCVPSLCERGYLVRLTEQAEHYIQQMLTTYLLSGATLEQLAQSGPMPQEGDTTPADSQDTPDSLAELTDGR